MGERGRGGRGGRKKNVSTRSFLGPEHSIVTIKIGLEEEENNLERKNRRQKQKK